MAPVHGLPEHLELPKHRLVADVPPLGLLHHGVGPEQHALQPLELVLSFFCLGPLAPLDHHRQGSAQEVTRDRGNDGLHCKGEGSCQGELCAMEKREWMQWLCEKVLASDYGNVSIIIIICGKE